MPASDSRRALSPGVSRWARFSVAIGLHELRVLATARSGRLLIGVVGLIAVGTLVGLALLWPSSAPSAAQPGAQTVPATVTNVADAECGGPDTSGQLCRTITIDPAGAGAPATIALGPAAGAPRLAAGDPVRVAPIPVLDGAGDARAAGFAFVGTDRVGKLVVALALLCLLAVAVLRGRGLLALAGVGLSLWLLIDFLVPAILAGHSPVLVALVSAFAVMFITLVLTNGIGAQTLASALGISFTLLFTAAVGVAAAKATGVDGSGSELATVLAQATPGLSLEGILLAGMVIGGLGVLSDTAVTQASAVMALRHTDVTLGRVALYRRAVVIGRDHLSATIHTLVLAYAGTALPLLLVLHAGGVSAADTVNNTDIAEPILATIVGIAGLILAVPVTTFLAALLVGRIPPELLPERHGHAH